MAQIKTIDTVAGENQIDFKRRYPFVWLKNLGDTDVYISDKAGIVAEADGVVLLGAGQAAMLENYDDCVYVLGATTIEAHGQHSADSPFGDTIVAGGGGGGTIESLTVTQNGIYTASGGVDGYSPVTVEVPEPVLVEKTITQNGVYDPEDDNADGYSMIDVEVPAVEVIELNANMNRTYTAPAGKAYSPVNVSVPGTSISKLTVGHNNVTYEAGIGTAFDPVEVSIPMDTLNAPSNGVYEIDTTTQDGWDTVVVDVYEKYKVLFGTADRNPENWNGLVEPVTADNCDEFYMTAFYAYNDASAPTGNYAAIWSTRYPIDAMMHKTNVGACGSDNFMWTHANQYDPANVIRGFYASYFGGYAYPFVYIGVKDKDAQRTTLYHDGTAAIRTDITLSDSIFNYDELILTFATGSYQSNNHATASAYPVSTIQVGKQLCGFNDATGAYFAYEVTSATQLTLVHYQDFYLVDVQGIKNDSMEETVIFTNPSSSSVPATVTLSQTYKEFDEICLVGHTADAQFEDMIVTQYYPVKALTREFDVPVDKRISMFLDAENCWLSINGDTTLVPDTTSPAIILDKIIGINKPVLSVAHELIDVEPLSVTQNGTYTAPSGTAYSPVTVDIHDDKYDLLYGNWYAYTTGPSSIGTKRLVKPITEYDDIIIWTSFLFQGNEWTNFVRYPASEIAGKNYNVVAYGGNYVTGSISADGIEITDTGREYQAIVAVYGIEVNNMERTTIFENTGSTNPATYSLPTGKVFTDYDEFIIIGEKDNYVYASYVPTSEIYVNTTWFGISIGSTGKTMYFSDNSTITDDTTQTILVKKIIGVKYGA